MIPTAITVWGFPCCVWSPLPTCHRHYPGRFSGACSLVLLHCQRPSLCNSQVGSCNCFFGACLAFTHVMACTLAESLNDPLHRKLRQLRCLRCRFDCYRVERTSSRAGVAPAEVQRLSRRTVTPTIRGQITNQSHTPSTCSPGSERRSLRRCPCGVASAGQTPAPIRSWARFGVPVRDGTGRKEARLIRFCALTAPCVPEPNFN